MMKGTPMSDMNPILRNIYEQPTELERVLDDLTTDKLGQLRDMARMMSLAGELVLTSMGSALYSLMPMYEELRERGCRNVWLEETGDLIRHPERMSRNALYVLMSRSGESREVADFAVWCREHGYTTLAITMTPTSTMAVNCTYMLHDVSSYDDIVCIKAYSTMALTGLLLVEMMNGCERPSEELIARLKNAFSWMEQSKEGILSQLEAVPFLADSHSFYLLSRSYGINMMRSASLWLEETAKTPANVMSIDNFYHGPMEIIRSHAIVKSVTCPVLFDVQPDARSAMIWGRVNQAVPSSLYFGPEGSDMPGGARFQIPDLGLGSGWSMLVAALYFQLLSYQVALANGIEPGFFYDEGWVVL